MASAPENFIDTQRALFETSQAIGRKGLEGAARILELNMQVTHALLAGGVNPMATVLASSSICGAGTRAPLQAEALTSYLPRTMEIASGTNAEIARLLLEQGSEIQSLVNEMLAATLQTAPDGSSTLLGMMGAPFDTMQRAFSAAGRTSSQAAESSARVGRTGSQKVDAGGGSGGRSMQAEE